MSDELFSVWIFYRDGGHERILEDADGKTAVDRAHRLTESVGARLGVIVKVIITDTGDFTVFMWELDKGVTYPPRPSA